MWTLTLCYNSNVLCRPLFLPRVCILELVLDSVPDIDMLEYLPDFLGGLFNMLSDPNRDIRQQADAVLGEFLSEIKSQNASEDSDETRSNFDFGSIIKILVSKANHTDEFTQLTALAWLHDFVKIAGTQLITYFAEVLDAVLPCLSHHNHRMCQVAQNTNEALLELDTACVKTLDSLSAIKVIKKHLEKCEHGERSSTNLEGYDKSEKTWLEALKWLSVLLKRYHAEVLSCLEELLPLLLNATADGSETVVLQALEVQAIIAKKKADFKRLISALLDRFRGKEGMELLQERGGLVIRRLCSLLGAESIYRTLSSLLKQEKDLPFASRMVQALNLILLTAPELSGPRNMLKDLAHCEGGAHLFCALYNSWCHSAGATLSLCLLAGVYNHACDLIASMGSLDINVNTLMEMDRLVSLLESPIYAGLRLKLLEPARHPSLFKALYGLLAILPQSKAFSTLNDRIRSIPSIELLQLNSLMDRGLSHSHSHSWSFKGSKNASREIEIDKKDKEKRRDHSEMNFVELLHMFVQCQQRHIEFESKQSSKRQ